MRTLPPDLDARTAPGTPAEGWSGLSEVTAPGFAIHTLFRRGGMCEILGVSDGQGNRFVLKTVRPDRVSAASSAALLREGDVLGSLAHPCVPELIAAGELSDGRPFLVLPELAGSSLAERLAATTGRTRSGSWSLRALSGSRSLRALSGSRSLRARVAPGLGRALLAVCEVLDHAHGRGVVHGDLTPANVVVGRSRTWVIDWGSAWRLSDGPSPVRDATPGYTPPEHGVTGPSIAGDLYAMGAILARLPHPDDGLLAVIDGCRDARPSARLAWRDALPAAIATWVNSRRCSPTKRAG